MYSVYFLRSQKNGKTYVGVTAKNARERLREHNSGSNNFTSQNGPFDLLYFEEYLCKEDALHRERFYKSGVGRRIRDAIIEAQLPPKADQPLAEVRAHDSHS